MESKKVVEKRPAKKGLLKDILTFAEFIALFYVMIYTTFMFLFIGIFLPFVRPLGYVPWVLSFGIILVKRFAFKEKMRAALIVIYIMLSLNIWINLLGSEFLATTGINDPIRQLNDYMTAPDNFGLVLMTFLPVVVTLLIGFVILKLMNIPLESPKASKVFLAIVFPLALLVIFLMLSPGLMIGLGTHARNLWLFWTGSIVLLSARYLFAVQLKLKFFFT